MPTQQEIHDRIDTLNHELVKAGRAATARELSKQKAERHALQAACGERGHVFTNRQLGSLVMGRCCAACGIAEPDPKKVTSNNLTKGA